ncbi:MAG: hypothetical protein ACQEQF_11500 [Bacillota bacterium]
MVTSSFEKAKFIVTDSEMIDKINKEIYRTKSGKELNKKRDDYKETIKELKRGKKILKSL